MTLEQERLVIAALRYYADRDNLTGFLDSDGYGCVYFNWDRDKQSIEDRAKQALAALGLAVKDNEQNDGQDT